MPQYIDMHCDTLMISFISGSSDLLDLPSAMIDLKRMQQGNAMAQFFAIFMLPEAFWSYMKREPVSDMDYIHALHNIFTQNMQAHSDIIAPATNYETLMANKAAGKMSGVLTIEDSRTVEGKLENIQHFYDLGVRAMSLTWNAENCFGYPNSTDPEVMNKGLTNFGKEAVAYMQELGILVDVSHLSDGGFMDLASICKKPFIATHSNCRALSPHQRNLTDKMIRILGEHGGVSGLNFGPEFLNADLACKQSTAELIAKHARHMADVGGIEVVALGSDFDGIGGELEVSDCSKMPLLEDALKKEGFNDDAIEKIFNLNVLRVFQDSVK